MKRMNAYELTKRFIVGDRGKQVVRTESMPIYKACEWVERAQSSLNILPVVNGTVLWDAKVQEEYLCEGCGAYFLIPIEGDANEEHCACPCCGEVDRVYDCQTIIEVGESA